MKVPIPERGQPVDLAYLSEIAKGINDLSNEIQGANATSIIDNGINLREDLRTNNIRFFATTVTYSPGKVRANETKDWDVDFSPPFLYVPVVTATVQNNARGSDSAAGNNIIVTIKNITTGKVDGTIRYNQNGSADITINVIAIGVPK